MAVKWNFCSPTTTQRGQAAEGRIPVEGPHHLNTAEGFGRPPLCTSWGSEASGTGGHTGWRAAGK